MGHTREVWFIRNHFLCETYTYKELEPWLNEIMSTSRSYIRRYTFTT
jgi:hypothetical protein